MEKNTSISELTSTLKNAVEDMKAAIITKGILDGNTAESNISKYDTYIRETIISNFENNLKTAFGYPDAIIELIYKKFSKGGYYFWKKYQEPYSENGTIPLENIPIPNTEEIKKIFKTSKITYDGKEYDIAYFSVLNLTNFDEINTLFRNNRTVVGFSKIIYDGDKVTTLESMFTGCWSLHAVTLEAVNNTSKVSIVRMFDGCVILEDFTLENIVPKAIDGILGDSTPDENDINSKSIEKLDLTKITSCGSLGYIRVHSNSDKYRLNLYMPRCMQATHMLTYAPGGCGNITLGVGCTINAGTFGWANHDTRVGIISGVMSSIDFTAFKYIGKDVHNWLYSVATDVRTYGHPNDSNESEIRKLTFNTDSWASYNTNYLSQDKEDIVFIQDTLTETNTLYFDEGDNELKSLNAAITKSETLKKPIEKYDAIYNRKNSKRYYVTDLDGQTVTAIHQCNFTIVEEDIAILQQGTIFELMDLRNWTYG
jgi:hypothetical protein